ncbi:hypothetical protein PINS_up021334 [Pythium insidiosum]|nr:hypothetical protein PINS_up021334 [Pythium insidiosum]
MQEMIELYEKKGISSDDAQLVVRTLAKYKEAFIDIMMVEELNLMAHRRRRQPAHGWHRHLWLVHALWRRAAAAVPREPHPRIGMSSDTVLYSSCVLTVITLFALGAFKGSFVGQKWPVMARRRSRIVTSK